MNNRLLLGFFAAPILLLSSPEAAAIEITQNGGSACTGHTAVDDAALSKRTTGLFNDSSGTVNISCNAPVIALHVPPNDSQRAKVQFRFVNPTSSYKTLTCKVVPFIAPNDPAPDLTNSSVRAAPRSSALLLVDASYSRFSTVRIGVTCALPGHTALQEIKVFITEFKFQQIE